MLFRSFPFFAKQLFLMILLPKYKKLRHPCRSPFFLLVIKSSRHHPWQYFLISAGLLTHAYPLSPPSRKLALQWHDGENSAPTVAGPCRTLTGFPLSSAFAENRNGLICIFLLTFRYYQQEWLMSIFLYLYDCVKLQWEKSKHLF